MISERTLSRVLESSFFFALLFSTLLTWYTMVLQEHFVIYTDPELVPEPTDFFAEIITYVHDIWTH